MADLIIAASHDLGPLSVEVVAAGGERRGEQPILLSSSRPQATIRGLAPGPYAVVATRPTGETLVERVTLGDNRSRVQFETEGRSPHEFLYQAMARGFVPSVPADLPHNEEASIKTIPTTTNRRQFAASGASGRALQALLTHSLRSDPAAPADRSVLDLDMLDFGEPQGDARPKALALWQWSMNDGRWQPVSDPIHFELRPDYLQLFVENDKRAQARAFGLLDEGGFGPIVIAPLFRQGISITFLADGVKAENAAERVANPSAIRVPVAVAVPRDAGLADILSGLAAASLPGAGQLWTQDVERRFGSSDHALDALLHKYKDPAAAVLGAHFLARFNPTTAPISWLENLSRLLPHVADPPTLLAWRLIAAGSTDERKTSRRDIRAVLRDANRRPGCLFARTRALLTQASRFYDPKPRPRSIEPPKRARRPQTCDFLDVGAEAGGLEAFWGSSPSRPGRPARAPRSGRQAVVVHLARGSFRS
jgi:hypothetical protein